MGSVRRVLLLALLLAPAAHAGVIAEGDEAFSEGDLDAAIEAWSAGLESGAPSGRLLYNLGNAWYRKDDLPRAIAAYRAAQRLRPRDGNVHHNLALARAGLVGVPAPPPPTPGWSALLTAGELALVGFGLTGAGSLATMAWWRRRVRVLLVAGLLGVVLGLGVSGAAWIGATQGRVAVVVDQEIPVRDAAQPDAGTLHALVPGAEVRVLRTLGDFHLVEDGRGRRGWVPRNAVFAPGS